MKRTYTCIHITYAYTRAHKAYKQLLFRYKYIMKLHIRLTSFEIIIKSRSICFTDIKNEIQFLICG